MRPGDTITGTVTSALVTAMQFSINLRTDSSELELVVIRQTPNGKTHSRRYVRVSGVVAPSVAQISTAMTQIEATALADIQGLLS